MCFLDYSIYSLFFFVSVDCFDNLGMKSRHIKTCQITSSIVEDFNSDLVQKDRGGGFVVYGVRGLPFYEHEYLQVRYNTIQYKVFRVPKIYPKDIQ